MSGEVPRPRCHRHTSYLLTSCDECRATFAEWMAQMRADAAKMSR